MELHQVRYFLALARSLNFTRAAEQCKVSQPALTKAVHKLELELGGVLIHRERQLTQLTDLGKLVLPMLERTYAAAESVRTSAEEFRRKEIAPLKIAMGSWVSAAIMESPLVEIARVMPGLQVELIEAEPQEVVEMLLGGDVNAVIAGDLLGELPVRIDHWTLFRERFLVLMPRESRYAEWAAMPADVLEQAVWIEPTGCEGASCLWRNLFPAGTEPKIGHRGRQLGRLQYLVSAGLGLMLWPEHAPHTPSLVTRPIVGDRFARNVQLFAVAGRRYSPALEALVKIARVHNWRSGFPVRSASTPLEEPSSGGAEVDVMAAAQESPAPVNTEEFDHILRIRSDPEIGECVNGAVTTTFHPVGTCQMGQDAGMVVDARRGICGIDGLRVIDASIMPKITSDDTNDSTKALPRPATAMPVEDLQRT